MAKMRVPSDEEQKALNQQLQAYLPFASGGVLSANGLADSEVEAYLLARRTHKFFPSMNAPEASSLLFPAISEARASSKQPIEILDVFAEIDKKLDRQGADTFTMLAFLNARKESCPDEISVAGTTFKKLEWPQVYTTLHDGETARVDAGEYSAFEHLHDWTCYSYDVIIPEYRSNNVAGLMTDLLRPFEQFRMLLNFAYDGGRITHSWSVHLKAMARYLPSPFHFVLINGVLAPTSFFYEEVEYRYEYHSVSVKEWQSVDALNKKIFAQPVMDGSINDAICELLSIYQRALDSLSPAVTFLHFWQILERIASPEQEQRGLENKQIISRLDTLITLRPSDRKILKELGEIRNEFAHRGNFSMDNGQPLNRILKVYVDHFLFRLIRLIDKFPMVIDLREYYDVALNRSEARLSAIENAIKFIRESATFR
jgi:hypothetical protein